MLFPGLVLPLHIFEERYRRLVQDLMDLPEDAREFGVVAIREGREVGADGTPALFPVGCTARLRDVERLDDGRYDIVTVGSRLFRLTGLRPPDLARPYLSGEVEWLPDETGDEAKAQLVAASVRLAFADYFAALSEASGQRIATPELPDDPRVLSHLVAATTLLDLADRQDLLEQVDGQARLRRELSVLRRECGFLRALTAAPAPDLARTPYSSN